jgi:hypothetical protein
MLPIIAQERSAFALWRHAAGVAWHKKDPHRQRTTDRRHKSKISTDRTTDRTFRQKCAMLCAASSASLAAVFAAAIDATDSVAASFRASAPLYIASTRAPIATNSPVVVVVGEEKGRREPPKVVHKPPRNHKRTSCAWARRLGFQSACRASTWSFKAKVFEMLRVVDRIDWQQPQYC